MAMSWLEANIELFIPTGPAASRWGTDACTDGVNEGVEGAQMSCDPGKTPAGSWRQYPEHSRETSPIPEVYLMGHSSGAHIALLYLTRRSQLVPSQQGSESLRDNTDSKNGEPALRLLGFIGLSGVYDVYRHYLYESWR